MGGIRKKKRNNRETIIKRKKTQKNLRKEWKIWKKDKRRKWMKQNESETEGEQEKNRERKLYILKRDKHVRFGRLCKKGVIQYV